MTLKRFDREGRKVEGQIQYSSTILLDPYMSPNQSPVTYDLLGQVLHIGCRANSGHYIAQTKGPHGSWFNIDDARVSPLASAPINNANAYILFYAKQSQPDTGCLSARSRRVSFNANTAVHIYMPSHAPKAAPTQSSYVGPPRDVARIDLGCGRALVRHGQTMRLEQSKIAGSKGYIQRPPDQATQKQHPFQGGLVVSLRSKPSLGSESSKHQICRQAMADVHSQLRNKVLKRAPRFYTGLNGPYTRDRLRDTLHDIHPQSRSQSKRA
jgi:hypothetical protein